MVTVSARGGPPSGAATVPTYVSSATAGAAAASAISRAAALLDVPGFMSGPPRSADDAVAFDLHDHHGRHRVPDGTGDHEVRPAVLDLHLDRCVVVQPESTLDRILHRR